jgi:hypothetical protein
MVERLFERAHRLYEQERGKPEGLPRLGVYVERVALDHEVEGEIALS